MARSSRREFLQTAATSAAAVGVLGMSAMETKANPLGMPLGCQTWPVREMIAKDFPGTIKQLNSIGFETVELCSPAGYEKSGFGGLAKYSGADLRKILNDNGVTCVSSHFNIDELRKDLDGRIAWAKSVGLTQMIVPSLDGPKNPTTDDVKKASDESNAMGKKTAAAGIQLGLHNEDFEMSSVDGKRTYDILFQQLDPQLVKFQFQIATISKGFDAAEYFTRYPGRFISMHVQGWSAETKKTVPVGQGTLDWKKIFSAAKVGGIKNYYVEMNFEFMKESVPYLKNLQV
jgi:sugar phosphate isomerase/epimerase